MLTRMMCLLLSFEGRISRKGFWLGIVLLTILAFVLVAILGAVALPYWEPHVISAVGTLVLLYPSLAVGVKRLHDRNKSAFPWAFIFFGPQILAHISQFFGWGFTPAGNLPGAPDGMMMMQPTHPITIGLIALSVIVFVWALIELGFMKGTDGTNNYGRDPHSFQPGEAACAN